MLEGVNMAFSLPPFLLAAFLVSALILFGYYSLLKARLKPTAQATLPEEVTDLPHLISPGNARYIWKGTFDADCFISATLSAVVKGQYSVKWKETGYTLYLIPNKAASPLSNDEHAALSFTNGRLRDVISISPLRTRFTDAAESRMQHILKTENKGKFQQVLKFTGVGVALTALLTLLSTLPYLSSYAILIGLYACLIAPLIFFLVGLIIKAWQEKDFSGVVKLSLFLGICLPLLFLLERSTPVFLFPGITGLMLINFWGYHSLPQYTSEGLHDKLRIEAFKQHIEGRLQQDPQLNMEGLPYLPYLVALEVKFGKEAYFTPLLTQQKEN